MRNIKLITALFILIMVAFSCHEDNDDKALVMTCDLSNPTEDFEWLKNVVDDLEQTGDGESYLLQGTYNDKTVFIVASCCTSCNYSIPVYHCDGEYIGAISNNDLPYNLLENATIIWKPDNFKCLE